MGHHNTTTPRLTRAAKAALGDIACIAAVTAVAITLIVAPTGNAETPAERCKRETAAYNNTWKQAWVLAHPGTTINDAPAPTPPYTCGQNNQTTPTITTPSTTEETPTTTTPSETTSATSTDRPNLTPPTSRNDNANGVAPGQPTIANGAPRNEGNSTNPQGLPSSESPSTTSSGHAAAPKPTSPTPPTISRNYASTGVELSPAGCELNLHNPHGSHDEPGTVSAKGEDTCDTRVEKLWIAMKLWENRWWGWDEIQVGDQPSAVNYGEKILRLRINSTFCNPGMDTRSTGDGYSIENGKQYRKSADTSLGGVRPIEIKYCR